VGVTHEQVVRESRIAGIATIPGREAALRDVLDRITPQVDHVYLACNRYGGALEHELMEVYPDGEKVSYCFPDHPYNKDHFSYGRQDNNKFLSLNDGPPGYRFPLDDDILHPPTLIEDSIAAIEKYHRKAVVSWGGKRFDRRPITSYYHGMSVSFHALHKQGQDYPIHIPLSGAMSWHTSMITFDIENWIHPLMADIWAALDCLRQGVPVMALARPQGYLVHSDKIDLSTTIYETEKRRDEIQTRLVDRQWPALQWPS